MSRKQMVVINSLLVPGTLLLVTLVACSLGKRTSQPAANNQPNQPTQQQPQTTQPAQQTQTGSGALQVGQASGSYTANGETVELKYAYAGRGRRFGSDSIIVLVTDKPIPSEAVAEEIESQTMFYDKKILGLEYVIDKDGYWVRFHPSQYQESKTGQLKEFSIEGDTVKGRDEDAGDLTNGKYARSVRFAAALIKGN